jgi:fatty-acyl-CoA synthase
VKLWIEVDDGGPSLPGALAYEEVIAGHDPAPRITRSPDDVYMLYTGGTTGMPKGVMYDMGGILQAFIAIGFPIVGLGLPEIDAIPALTARLWEEGRSITSIPACPLMHGTGQWLGAMIPHCAGARIVILTERSFDGRELWEVTEREKATQLVIVGDAFAKPMLRALDEAKSAGSPHDVSSVKFVVSSGVMWTAEVKAQLLDWHDFVLIDAMGSSEGAMGSQITTRGNLGQTARFVKNPTTRVFTEDGREVEPGSGEAGMVAAGGNVPFGYYKDEAKSATTFRTIDGVRYSFPGDWALVEADGSLTLLGRGSNCINTAGEKVYPEEVEEAVKEHPDVIDCLVVGVDDEKFGQRVTGVASLRAESDVDGEALRRFTRSKLAGYKVPRSSPATRCRSSSSSWTRCVARRTARPTTSGPARRSRRRSRAADGARRPGEEGSHEDQARRGHGTRVSHLRLHPLPRCGGCRVEGRRSRRARRGGALPRHPEHGARLDRGAGRRQALRRRPAAADEVRR